MPGLKPSCGSSGPWHAVKSLTEQMKSELIPVAQNEKIFAIAQTRRVM
jgi:hypothetical protein